METLRWENYLLRTGGAFNGFWASYLSERPRDTLYIMGMGFDPRTNTGIKAVYSNHGEGKRDTITLRYYRTEDEIGKANDPRLDEHIIDLEGFLSGCDYSKPVDENIILYSPEQKPIAPINAQHAFTAEPMLERVKAYTDIIVDISAMPRGIFMPILRVLLSYIDKHNSTEGNTIINLHAVVTENSLLDSKIYDKAPEEEADYIQGFRITETAAISEKKEVWIPILGERQKGQFQTLRKSLLPVETSPILPFPAEDLRRGDKLIDQYKELLFNDSNFSPKNIVYADEGNPFQVYRVLNQMVQRYEQSFRLLKGCKIIVSALSSKLLSIGAFLAVYEAREKGNRSIGIKHVDSKSQDLTEEYKAEKDLIDKQNNLFEIWLAGEAYV